MILDVAARRASLTPDRPAIFWQGRWRTYRELDERATRAASLLADLGVQRGDRVSIAANNDLAHFDLVFATAKLGFIFTPLNVRLSEPELRGLGDYLRPKVILHDTENEAGGAAAAEAGASLIDLASWERDVERRDDQPTGVEAPALTPEDPQMILLTGGTTGLPKGAMISYRQVFYNAVNTVFSWGLNQDDRIIQSTPCYHAAINALATPLLHLGASVILQRRFDPAEELRLVAEQGVTIVFAVPTMLNMLVNEPAFSTTDFRGVRWAISGGAPCPEPVRRAFSTRGVHFRQGYGLTEAGVNCFTITTEQAAAHPTSVGKPMLHAEATVRRPDGSVCEVGEVGELTLRGPHVFLGYYDRPEATADVLRDGWLWTGDLCTVDEDGFFTIVGRRKEMFISGGENVFPVEVENALYDHPAVRECAVFGIPDEQWGEVGMAVIVLRTGHTTSGEEFREHLRGRLARYKVPKRFEVLAELPKSAAGKILKTALRDRFMPTGSDGTVHGSFGSASEEGGTR